MADEVVESKPPDCEHKEYTFGCERCFVEMKALAMGNAQADTFQAQLNGGQLAIFHVINILISLERQTLNTAKTSLDLNVISVAKNVYANLHQVTQHLMVLTMDQQQLAESMTLAAETVDALERHMQEAKAVKETPSITLTDGG